MVKQTEIVKQKIEHKAITEARERLEALFAEIPFVRLKGSRTDVRLGDTQVDLILNVLVSGKPIQFAVEVKTQGEPRLVRVAAEQLKKYRQGKQAAYGIIIAPYLSDASRWICKEAGIGCVDLAGNAFISFQSIFIDKTGIPNPFAAPRVAKSLFFPKSSRVLRVLFAEPARRWRVEEISKEAKISIGLASRMKQALLDQEWIAEENKRFFPANPEKALAAWSAKYSYTLNASYSYYSGLKDEELAAAIRSECQKRGWEYGLALFTGARRVAPFVTFPRFFVYVKGDIIDLAKSLQFKKVESGANVTILSPYDDGVFYRLQDVKGAQVVSNIQLYLDLKSYMGRGEEAAQVILDERIKPGW
jgi:hypothetical protein